MTLPHSPFAGLALAADIVAGLGCLQAAIGAVLVWRFVRAVPRAGAPATGALPPISVLKPLHGDEPMLEEALAGFCTQDYPEFQIVFGVQDAADSAIPVVRRLQARFPARDLALVIDPTQHGTNRKVGNLINMLPAARHATLVISDSDIHAEPGYLRRVTASLLAPGVGLVTTLYGGRPASGSVARRLAAAQINHNFLPGVLMSRLIGREDCLGATMALRRETLDAIGGLEMLSPHIADDSVLGHAVAARGLSVAIAHSLTMTTTSETGLGDMFGHELRWGRTVRSVEPLYYALSSIQFPLSWASLAVVLAPASSWSWAVLALVWLWRFGTARSIDRMLDASFVVPFWLLPVRDWVSAVVMIGSFTGRRVAWRGHTVTLSSRTRPSQDPAHPAESAMAEPAVQTSTVPLPETVD